MVASELPSSFSSEVSRENPFVFKSLYFEGTDAAREYLQLTRLGEFHTPTRHPRQINNTSFLLVPGLGGDLRSLIPLQFYLGQHGLNSHFARVGVNAGYKWQLDATEQQAWELRKKTGKPITIFGHSLGGIFGRAVANRLGPDVVGHVISAGTPHAIEGKDLKTIANPAVRRFGELMGCFGKSILSQNQQILNLEEIVSLKEGIRATNFWTQEEAVVRPDCCIEKRSKARSLPEEHTVYDIDNMIRTQPEVINIALPNGDLRDHRRIVRRSTHSGMPGNIVLLEDIVRIQANLAT